MAGMVRRNGWLLIGVVGCTEAPPAAPTAPAPASEPATAAPALVSPDQLCQAYCDRWAGCGKPAASCACQAQGKNLAVFNPAYIGRLMLCLDGVPCATLDDGSAWSACHDTTLQALPPSDDLRDFCFASARRAAECGTPDQADQSACLVTFRHVSDAAIADASSCLKQECGEVPRCVRWALSPKDA